MRLPWRRPARPPLKTVRHVPPVPPPAVSDLSDLEAQARYHRERLALYKARLYGGRAHSEHKLQELQQASDDAQARMSRAEARQA